jgi:surface carbohydrate biosynthesis protein
MNAHNPLLLIPVENQVREFDPKLLLACVAAQRGFSSVIGSRRELEFNIDNFPRAIYLSKSMTIRSLLFFRIARRLGHKITAWDEEALVHLPPETYFSRRLDKATIRYVTRLFAWGQDNAELWQHYPNLPAELEIHPIGNPRSDMLRAEIRAFYEKDAADLRQTHGDFILVNTNFNHVNSFGPDMNLFNSRERSLKGAKFGRAARGMSQEYAEGLWEHKHAVFSSFREMIPKLEQSFPDHTIIVRPHPTEKREIYHRIAARYERMRVINEGNIVPWLMATRAVIHNGCTTGVEAYVLGIPAISYRAVVDERYDDGFYHLPNRLSHQCFDFDQLEEMLRKIMAGKLGAASGAERRILYKRYLSSQEGPLACERIIDILEQTQNDTESEQRAGGHRYERWLLSRGLRLARMVKSRIPGSHNRPAYQRHRFPGLSLEEVHSRVSRFQALLGYGNRLKVERVSNVLFRINA